MYEFGEQVLAKPKGATNRSKRKELWSQDFTMPRGWDTMTGARGHRCFEGRRSSNQGQEAKSRGRAMERDCNQGTSWRRQTCPTRRMTARKTPGANATREAWILVLREGSFFQNRVSRACLEQELQNQQPHLGEVRPDDGMQRMREQNDWGRCEATLK